jgi:predicted DNA-binding transcriptional regulator YafY
MSKHYFSRLERLDLLIRRKATGTPKTLSQKMGVSERTVYKYIEILESLGASIAYSKTKESYVYENDGYFNFRFISKQGVS